MTAEAILTDEQITEQADFEAWTGYSEEALSRSAGDDGYCIKGVDNEWRAYQAGRAALQSQDRGDSERIDFIEANPGWLRVCRLGHPTKQQWACVSPFTNYEFDGFKTAREAIDHARRIEGDGK